MKKIIAFLLAALLLLGLTACSSSGSTGTNSGSGGSGAGTGTVTPVTSENIIGKWRFDIQISSEKMKELMMSVLSSQSGESTQAAAYTEYLRTAQVPAAKLSGSFRFNEDGTVDEEADQDSMDSIADSMTSIAIGSMPVLLRSEAEKKIQEQSLNMTADEYLNRALGGVTPEAYAQNMESTVRSSMIEQLQKSLVEDKDAYYSLEDGKLYKWKRNESKDPAEYIDVEMRGGKLILKEFHSKDANAKSISALMAPIELTKVD